MRIIGGGIVHRAARAFNAAYNGGVDAQIAIPQAELARFCQRYHIRRVLLFGSVLREDFGWT